MRILLFSSTYRPLVGGVETVTDRLARGLKVRGHDVSVVTNRYPRSLPASEVVDGIVVRRRVYPNLLPSPGRRPALAILKQVLSVPLGIYELASLVTLLRRERPDVVNAHYLSYPAAYVLVAASLAGVPVVLSFHGSDVPSSPYPATYRWVGRLSCRHAAVVTCGSEDLAEYLRQAVWTLDAAKILVCHFGVDDGLPMAQRLAGEPGTEAAVIAIAEDAGTEALPYTVKRPFVLAAGRLVEKKGMDVAIRAMSHLMDADSADIMLVIAGSGPLESELRRLAAEVGVSKRVQFLGSVPPDRLRELLAQSLMVVIPSKWEAFGVIALEAMIAGRAVIATNRGGISEIVVDGRTGVLVPPDDPEALAKAIHELLADADRVASMGAEGRERALGSFGWEAVVARYESFLADAVTRG